MRKCQSIRLRFGRRRPDVFHHPLEGRDAELGELASILESKGIIVYRPKEVDWCKIGGYKGSMPREDLFAYAWGCRRQETRLALQDILRELAEDSSFRVVRAPISPDLDPIYDGPPGARVDNQAWVINNGRVAFDTADFMRFGKGHTGSAEHVTNVKGVEYLRFNIPQGYSIDMLDVTNPHAIHIDTVICPLR